jgi:CTD nuclear envelope phosphatase 1
LVAHRPSVTLAQSFHLPHNLAATSRRFSHSTLFCCVRLHLLVHSSPCHLRTLHASSPAMNSLAYISRQFDVFASARTPPSTPIDGQAPFLRHGTSSTRRESDAGPSFKRTNSWTNKPHQQPQAPDTQHLSRSKRSYSSPSGFLPISLLRPFPPTPPAEAAIRSKSRFRVRSTFRRLFLVQAFVLAWDTLCATWAQWTLAEIDNKGKGRLIDEGPEKPVAEATDVSLLETQPPLPSIPSPPSPDIPSDVLSAKSDVTTLPTPPPSPGPPPSSHLRSRKLPPATITDNALRSPTPPLTTAHKTPFHLPKTLVLDLDETLIHSTSKPMSSSSSGSGLLGFGGRNKGHTVEVILNGQSTIYHVYKRPFVDYFLRKVSRNPPCQP